MSRLGALAVLAAVVVPAALSGGGCGGNGDGVGLDTGTPGQDIVDSSGSTTDIQAEEMRPLEPPGCTPDCTGRECGNDGCGGTCGQCFTLEGAPDDSLCTPDGTCCAPDCAGRECGGDGCGGTCGQCGTDEQCQEGLCKPTACVPDCDGKECGGDGCGGACGQCAADEQCQEGLCKPTGCIPNCDGKECGYDGCTGSCGNCQTGEGCKQGKCVACVPQCTGKKCGGDGCGGVCGQCAASEECKEGLCKPTGCIPDCEGKECGDDGCGGSCGECAGTEVCQGFLCVACLPGCDGKECGDDGCGGSCGACPDVSECTTGTCTCPDGLEWNVDGTACWPVCPDNASYVPEAGECQCDPDTVLGLDGVTCLLECPPNSHAEEGACLCDPGTTPGNDGTTCDAPVKECGLHGASYPAGGQLPPNRFARTVNTENKYPIILDKLTGLTWQGCDAGLDGYTCTEGVLSQKKPASAVTYCENSTWAGFDDWHLPTMVDWLVVVDQGLSYPYGASEFFWYFDKIDTTTIWWSSTKPLFSDIPGDIQLALMKDDPAKFGFEFYIMYAITSFGRRVRCVRDPTPPVSHCAWIVGTPTDERVVHLEAANQFWQGCPAGISGKECQLGTASKMTWDEATAYCDGLVWGGFDDWSLPDLNLFATIVDYDVTKPPLVDPAVLPGTPGTSFWSSKAAPDGEYWTFDHEVGQPVATPATFQWSVRCTRHCPGNFAGPTCDACAPGWQGVDCTVGSGQ